MKRAEFPTSRESVQAIIDSCFMDGKIIKNAKGLTKEERKSLRMWVASFDSSNAIKPEKQDAYLKARKILGMRFYVKMGTEIPEGIDPADMFFYEEKVNLLSENRELTAYVVKEFDYRVVNGQHGVTSRYLSDVGCAVTDTGETVDVGMDVRREVARLITESIRRYNEEEGALLTEGEIIIMPTRKDAQKTFVPFGPDELDEPEAEVWEFSQNLYDDEISTDDASYC